MQKPWPVMLTAYSLGIGGSERQLCEIAKSLDRRWFEPHVGCFHPEGMRADELRQAGVPLVEFATRSLRSPATLSAAAAVGRYLRRHDIAMVHSFDVPSTIFAVPVARLYGTPAVLSSQRAYRDLSSGLYRRLLRVTDRLVDGIVVNCQAIKLHLVEQERVAERLIHVCYNGLDSDLFCGPPNPRRRVAPLEGASFVIGTLCGLRPEKDLKTLVEAFSSIRRIVPGAKLAIVGSGSEQDDLRRRVQALGCEGDCIFQDATTEVASWLRSFDIYVLPSRSEALSNVLMEAMACGCAVIASRVGGNPELVSDAKTGLLFEPGDSVQLAARLRELMTDAALRERLSQSAAQSIRQNFTLSQAVRQMEAVYFHYLERAGPEMKVAPTEHK